MAARLSDRIAGEQAALRRVATQVAGGAPPSAVFAAVAEEVGRLLGVDFTILSRYEPEDAQVSVGAWSRWTPTTTWTRTPLGPPRMPSASCSTQRCATTLRPQRLRRTSEMTKRPLPWGEAAGQAWCAIRDSNPEPAD
jgi:GAF domain-containing protein